MTAEGEMVLLLTEPTATLARVAIVAVLGLVVTGWGDVVVRRVFRYAGDVEERPAAPASGSVVPVERDDAAAVGTDLGEASALDDLPLPAANDIDAAAATLRGGKVIGWLERLGVYVCILTGFPLGLAAIVAIKGLARYPDLHAKDGTAERFIIGTFASVLWAAAGAGLAYWLVRVV